MRGVSSGRRIRAFSSLAGNRAMLRVLAAYGMFTLTEYAVWIAMVTTTRPAQSALIPSVALPPIS